MRNMASLARRVLPLLATMSWMSPNLAAAQDEGGMPDPAQVAAALDGHPSVAAALARVKAAVAEAEALALGPYEVTIGGSYVSRSVERERRYDEYDATLVRSIRLPGKARLDRKIGQYGVAAARNDAEDVRHQAARLLNEIWWDWLGSAEQARIDRQAVANLERLLDAVEKRASMRDAAQLETDQTRAMLGTARLAAEQSAGAQAMARARLATMFPAMNLPQTPPSVPRPEITEQEIAQLGQLVVERSHEIAAAEARTMQADASASRARADRIADPSLGLRVFSERSGEEQGAGLLFSLPLGGGHRRALADRADAEASAALADLGAIRFEIAAMSETDTTQARFAVEAWQRSREGLTAQVAALEKLRLGYREGEIDLADQLYAERQVHDAFRAEAAARSQALRATGRLRIDSHTIWVSGEDQ